MTSILGIAGNSGEVTRRKSEQARLAKINHRLDALEMLERITPERLEELARRCKSTPAKVRKYLRSQCHFDPEWVAELVGGKGAQ